MGKNLVIVESPAKAKTIEKFLGKDYTVMSSYGHVRDLPKEDISIDLEKNFEPKYQVLPDKEKIISELKKASKNAEFVWLATDEDREGEAIAWHLAETLKIEKEKLKRIVFHEITKTAILNAIENPRELNYQLVDAQQARRVLDRIVGYELSPVLWKKVKPSLSAGRVQSVAVRLIVEREEEIKAFNSVSDFKITGDFNNSKKETLPAELNTRFESERDALMFLESVKSSKFTVDSVEKKPATRKPAPPFTTSTLQQEAARKLGFSVSQTMTVAQQLYESGLITYMRTDSVNLSDLALSAAKKEIEGQFGKEYSKTRKFTTKSKGAQEAHEAIRPAYLNKKTIDGNANQKKLYDLIWKRTIASQMAEAKLEKTQVQIITPDVKQFFIARGEVIQFDGFLKVYEESSDEEGGNGNGKILPQVKKGDALDQDNILAVQKFTQHPPRYSEAALVKKLEELGIGRPSTYAPIISTIQKRNYIIKESRTAQTRKIVHLELKKADIKRTMKNENFGSEKNKLFPTDLGTVVTHFLQDYFEDIINYDFTANVEKEFDEVAEGKAKWNKTIGEFYKDFHPKVTETLKNTGKYHGEKLLGVDPDSGKNVYAKLGPYGAMVQIGESSDEEKPRFASLLKGQSIDTVTLEEALALFKFPKNIGELDGEEVIVSIGKYGPYVRHAGKFYSIPADIDPCNVELEKAEEIIRLKKEKDANNILRTFEEDAELQILKGRYGPYIKYKGKNYPLGKKNDPEKISLDEIKEIIKAKDEGKSTKKKGSAKKK
ncbi:MAG: type I DNA topoisomerase [Marinilabiliales bacterium]|nr:MAG: type I DNA topoisomerase [Marinilabiliales bacterium]